jgi:uracil-DNA glycosylase
MSKTLGERFLDKNNLPQEWVDILTPLVNSEDFHNILLQISNDYTIGVEPSIDKMFSAFQYIKPEDIRVIIIGQDPYPQKGVSTGIAFANQLNIQTLSPSLSIILDELLESIPEFNEFIFFENINLLHWLKQGVLPINSSFSVKANNPGSHAKIWKPFTESLLYKLDKKDLVVAMFGNQAGNFSHCFKEAKFKIKVVHPAADTYSNERKFRGSKVFLKINQNLEQPINWHGELKINNK